VFSLSVTGTQTKGRLLALPQNIAPGMKWLTVKNTLAYCNSELLKAANDKSFPLSITRDPHKCGPLALPENTTPDSYKHSSLSNGEFIVGVKSFTI